MNVAERRRLKPNELLVKEGTRSGELSIVLTGRLDMTRNGQRLGELGPDDAVGETVLISNAPHDVTVTAREESEILTIRRERLHQLMSDKASLGWKLLWSLSQILNMRLRTVDAELIRAADGIGQLSKVAPSVVVEKPQLGASFMGVASLPVQVTDELVPPFVDGTVEGGQTPL